MKAPGADAMSSASTADDALQLREDLIHPDPLLDCLVEVCRLHGQAASRASLSAGLPLDGGPMTLALAERAAARAGMATRLQRMAPQAIDGAVLPAILILAGQRACVLIGWADDGAARVLLPESGQGGVLVPAAELAARHTGVVLFVRPHFRFDRRSAGPASGRHGHWFWSAILAQRLVYRDVLWAAALINLCALALPIFTMNVYDRVVPNRAVETLWALAIGVLITGLAELLLRVLRGRFVDEASARVDVQLSATLFEKVLGLRLAHRPESVGGFASNLRGFEQVREFVAGSTVTALIDLPFALLFIAALVWISPWLALPPLVAFALIVGVGWVLQQRLHQLAETTWRASAQRNALLIEALGGLETVKVQGAEGVLQARWERQNLFLSRTGLRMRELSTGAMHGVAWVGQLVTVAVVVVGVYLIGERVLTLGALVAASMLAARALAPAGQVIGLLMQYQGARTALDGLDKLMALPVERPTADDGGSSLLQRRELAGAIEFRDVHFNYPNSDASALNGVSLRIAPGEHVAVIGRVGSGKSTLLRLIAGLYAPARGTLLVDQIDIRQLDPADLRRNLGYVSQDVVLFQGTLRENIALGLPYADDSAILAAAEAAGLREFVDRHPRGFDMPVGERGELLSGGQRQAVGLARAMLHNAPILLLDEPTSAMDFSAEAQVLARLTAFAHGRTVVLVTHRTPLLALVQRTVVVDQGRVVADGPRDEVLASLQAGRVGKGAGA
jgi:ATP-binding cassette subfamily C protein LapB